MKKLFKNHKLPKLIHDEIDYLSRSAIINKMSAQFKTSTEEILKDRDFPGKFFHNLKE